MLRVSGFSEVWVEEVDDVATNTDITRSVQGVSAANSGYRALPEDTNVGYAPYLKWAIEAICCGLRFCSCEYVLLMFCVSKKLICGCHFVIFLIRSKVPRQTT